MRVHSLRLVEGFRVHASDSHVDVHGNTTRNMVDFFVSITFRISGLGVCAYGFRVSGFGLLGLVLAGIPHQPAPTAKIDSALAGLPSDGAPAKERTNSAPPQTCKSMEGGVRRG